VSTADPLLSVVVPAYCEGTHLAISLEKIVATMAGIDGAFEIVVIDDGSTDTTWSVIQEANAVDERVRGIRLSRNFGKESALAAGLAYCRGDGVIVMDADLQHPPGLIPEMVRIWREDRVDIVEARKSRSRHESRVVRWRRKVFNGLMRRLSGFDLSDASDFKLLDRKVLDAWARLGERNLFFRGMVAWLGFRVARVPFEVDTGSRSGSTWSPLGLVNLALVGVTSFSSLPLRLASILGALFFLFAIAASVYTLVYRLLGHAQPGFTTVILLQMFTSALVLMCLGVIGEYLAKIYDEVKGRPRFVATEFVGIASADRSSIHPGSGRIGAQ
jgi:glycosyltransferase involved in cell wall biosynthesis